MTGQDGLQLAQQRRFDALFPNGAIALWVRPGGNSTQYNIAWIRVAAMAGLDPVLTLYCHGPRVLDGLQLTGWRVVRSRPHLIAQATFAHEPHPIQFCARVSETMALEGKIIRDRIRAGLAASAAEV